MSDDGPPAADFSWQAHPARERLGRAVTGGVLILLFGLLAGALMESAWWGVFAAGVLVLVLNRFFFPSRFALDEEGITAIYPLGRKRLRWVDVRRLAHDRDGAFLSTRVGGSRPIALRGMHVLLGPQRESVLARIRAHLPTPDTAAPAVDVPAPVAAPRRSTEAAAARRSTEAVPAEGDAACVR